MIRRLEERDHARIQELHREAGHDFDFPADMISSWVWVDNDDSPVMVVGARVIAEAVVISSKAGTPQQRLANLERMAEVVKRDVVQLGIREGVAWIPDSIYRAFSRRLKKFGWKAIRYRSMVWKLEE